MRKSKLFCVILLAILCMNLLVLSAAASAVTEYDGLRVTVEMDKEHYDNGESITATITVTNTAEDTITIVNLEQLIPDGYRLVEGSVASKENVDIKAGETITLQVSFEGVPEADNGEAGEGDFFDKLLYGETWGVPNILLAVLAAIAFGIFMLLT